MKRKLFFGIVIAVIAVFCVLSLAACSEKEFVPELLTVEQVEKAIPDHIRDTGFGIYFYKNATEYVRTTESLEDVPFDPAKPTVIFTHGVQFNAMFINANTGGWVYDEKFENAQGWLDAGYNVGAFLWSQFSDDMPNACEEKVWTRGQGTYTYKNAEGKRAKSEDTTKQIMKYSMVECFGAYYFGFMSQFNNYTGNEIRFQGHSLGGSTTFGICNYFLTLEKAGVITAEFMPDRVTIFDPFLFDEIEGKVPWLNGRLEEGSFGAAVETAKMLGERGIAAEYIKSSDFPTATLVLSDKNILDRMIENIRFLDMKTADHNISKFWYERSIDDGIMDNTNGGFGIGPKTPLTYMLATNGVYYTDSKANKNGAFNQSSQNIDFIKIAGVAFFDKNDNGINDGRLQSRVKGITVSLYDGDTLIAQTVTDAGGYYEFKLPLSDAGKSFDIRVCCLGDYKIGKPAIGIEGNAIDENGKSPVLVLADKEIAIINIGLVKK